MEKKAESVKIHMNAKGFYAEPAAILSHPNIARDIKKAQNSKLVQRLQNKAQNKRVA